MNVQMIRSRGCLFYSVQFALRLLHRDSRLEAGNYDKVELRIVRDQLRGRRDQGFEDFISLRRSMCRLAGHDRDDRKAERLGHYADNGVRLTAYAKHTAEDGRTTLKKALPGAPGENDFLVLPALCFLG